MSRVLITGYNGFTGRYVAEVFRARGYEVVGLVRDNAEQEASAYACDLLDKDRLQKVIDSVCPDYVVHLAAIAFVAHGDIDAVYRTNVVGTRNLLEALSACRRQPAKVLLASSANIYGNAVVDPITESTPASPANDYAVSKMAMEAMAGLWVDRLPIVIARPFNYTGVGQSLKFLLPKIVDHFRRNERAIELGNLDVARDFSEVRAIAKIYADLLESKACGESFNVCSGQVWSLTEILAIMADIAGYEIDVTVNPAFVRRNEVKLLRGSNYKLKTLIGDVQMPSLDETLRWMYEE